MSDRHRPISRTGPPIHDTTVLDLFDSEGRRPKITLVMDPYSRAFLSWSVSIAETATD